MDAVAITVGISWTLAGLVVIGLAVPLARGWIGPNRLYGVRLPESFRSDDAWYAINRYGGRRLILWAVPMVAAGAGCFFLPLQAHPALALAAGLAPLVFILIPVLQVWRFARRYRPGV